MTMRAFAVDAFGTAGSVRDLPLPEPGEGEIRVAVRAAGVNRMDPVYVGGMAKDWMEHRFPLVPGIDLAGVIDEVGAGVSGLAVGDEVYGVAAKPFVGAGTFAEYVVVGSGSVGPKPRGLSFVEAAAVPHAALTALGLVEAVDPQPTQTVVVIGACGGVGSHATQLAAARGAVVIALTGPGGSGQARQLGASEVLDYTSDDIGTALSERHPDGIDAVIATHADQELIAAIARRMRTGGTVASSAMGGQGLADALAEVGVSFAQVNRLSPERLGDLTELFESGRLKPVPITTYPLEEAGESVAAIAAGHTRGKRVVVIRE